jgi:hypothetical protein
MLDPTWLTVNEWAKNLFKWGCMFDLVIECAFAACRRITNQR